MIITLRPLEIVACDTAAKIVGVPLHEMRASAATGKALGVTFPEWSGMIRAQRVAIRVAAERLGVTDLRYDVARSPRADWLVLVDELTESSFGFAGCIRRADFERQSEIRNDGEPYRWLSRFDLSPFKVLIDELSPFVIESF